MLRSARSVRSDMSERELCTHPHFTCSSLSQHKEHAYFRNIASEPVLAVLDASVAACCALAAGCWQTTKWAALRLLGPRAEQHGL